MSSVKFLWSDRAIQHARDLGLSSELDTIKKWLDNNDFDELADLISAAVADKHGNLWRAVTYQVPGRSLPSFVLDYDADPMPPAEIMICFVIMNPALRRAYEANRTGREVADLRGYGLLAHVDAVLEPGSLSLHA